MPLSLLRLEERIVLDAAAPADADSDADATDHAPDRPGGDHAPAPDDAPNHARVNDSGSESTCGMATLAWPWHPRPGQVVGHAIERAVAALLSSDDQAPRRLLAVSSAVEQAEALTAATTENVDSIVFDAEHATLDALLRQIRDALDGQEADSIALATHGLGQGGFQLADGHAVNLETLQNPQMRAFWEGLADMVEPGGRIDILACDAAGGPQGQALLTALEDLTGVNFAASADDTGNAAQGANWLLESDDIAAGSIYFAPERLPDFSEVLAAPTITDTNPGNTAIGGTGPVVVDDGITVDDGGNGDLTGAAVRIKNGFVAGEDRLRLTDDGAAAAAAAGISVSYDDSTGALLLSGNASAAEYQHVLRTVTYENTSITPLSGAREIFFVIGDDFSAAGNYYYNTQNGHYYRPLSVSGTWAEAESFAAGSSLGGLQGYLATITSSEENAFLEPHLPPFGFPETPRFWLGAGDATGGGDWYWITGPEAGTQFWQNGPVSGVYSNWGVGQPNVTGESHAVIVSPGKWEGRDVPGTAASFMLEFGGMDSDAEGGVAASVIVNVATPNHAPVLDNAGLMSLAAIDEDDTASPGTTVASIIASAGGDRITDYNLGALEGFAVTAVDNAHGTWQYSADGGGSWHNIGAVANNHALLLRDSDLIRFRPDADWNGALTTGITFRAWDRTSGSTGSYADTTANGGMTAFSTATETASLVVNSVNDAPVLDNAGHMNLTAIDEDDITGDGNTVGSILASAAGDRITDADGGALEGIAVTGIDNSDGTWQYSTDGGSTWHDIGSVANDHALLLRPDDLIRFRPDADYNGTVTEGITFRAWDQTSGAAGGYGDTTVNGNASAFSAATETAGLVVNGINDAPTVANPLGDQTAIEDSVFTYQFAPDTFVDVDTPDTLTYSATLADGSPLPAWLTFDAATRMFAGTPANVDVGTLRVKVTADDGHGGIVSELFTITVSNTNDAPTVANPLVDQSVSENSAFAYQFVPDTFDDVDAPDTLTYAATLADGSPLPAWLAFDPATRTFTGTPGSRDVGTLSVKVTASDGHGGTVSDVFTITVSGVSKTDDTPTEPVTPTEPATPADLLDLIDNSSPGSLRNVSSSPSSDWHSTTELGTASSAEDSGAALTADDAGVGITDSQAADVGDAADTGDIGDTGYAADAGSEASSAAGATEGRSSGVVVGAHRGGHTGQSDGQDDVRHQEREEDLGIEAGQLTSQIQGAMFSGDLLSDEGQPAEFREAWNTILGAYAGSGEELSAYLQSAFRAVTESAFIYQAAEQSIEAMNHELTLAAEAGIRIDADAGDGKDGLCTAVIEAREDVKAASTELEAAILAAAEAGKEDKFDQVLEDVIGAALQRLMTANERLFVESQALTAATAVLREARLSGESAVDRARIAAATAQARLEAHAEITEMRKSWDRVARDVLTAFLARLADQQSGAGGSAELQQPGW